MRRARPRPSSLALLAMSCAVLAAQGQPQTARNEPLEAKIAAAARAQAAEDVSAAAALLQEAREHCRTDPEIVRVCELLAPQLLALNQLDEAAAAYGEIAERSLNPAQVCRARERLAAVFLRQRRVDDAIACYDNILAEVPVSDRERLRLRLARAQICEGYPQQRERAAKDYEALLNEASLTQTQRRFIQLRLARLRAALDRAEGAGATQPETPSRLVQQAEHRRRMGDVNGALRMYEQVLATQPNHSLALRRAFDLHRELGATDRFLARITAAWEQDKTPERTLALSEVLMWAGEKRRAAEMQDAVVAGGEADLQALIRAGWMWREAGDEDRALDYLRRATELKPEDVSAASLLADLLAGRGQQEEALTWWRKAARYSPGDAQSARRLGDLLRGHAQTEQALAAYIEAREANGDPAHLAVEIGEARQALGDLDAAIDEYTAALAGEQHAVQTVYAKLKGLMTDPEARPRVVARLEKLCRGTDAPREARIFLAQEYALGGRLQEAVQLLEADATAADPRWLLEIARRAAAEGEHRTALELLALADRDPASAAPRPELAHTSFEVREARGTSLGELGRWADAAEEMRRAIDAAPDAAGRARAYRRLSDILLYHLKQPQRAREAIETPAAAVGVSPAWILWRLAECAFFAGAWEDAHKRFTALDELGASSEVPSAAETEPNTLTFPPAVPRAVVRTRADGADSVPSAGHAAFRLAEIALRQGDFAEARPGFTAFAAQYAESPFCNEALRWSRLIATDFTFDPAAAERFVGGLVALDGGRMAKGEAQLQALVEEGEAQLLADDAQMLLAEQREQRGDLAGAATAYRELASRFPSSRLKPRALLDEARLLWRKLDQPEQGRERLTELVRDHPDSSLAETARAELDALQSSLNRQALRKAGR